LRTPNVRINAGFFASICALFLTACSGTGPNTTAGRTAGDAYNAAQRLASQDCTEGQRLYRVATQRDPRFVRAYLGIGDCAQKVGDFGAVRNAYTSAIALSKDDYQLYYRRGIIEGLQGDYSSGRNDERIAMMKAPHFVTAYAPISDAFYKVNDIADAIHTITLALAIQKSNELYTTRGDYERAAWVTQAAERDYSSALSLASTNESRAAALVSAAGLYQQMKQYSRAAGAMQRAIALAPQNIGYYDVAVQMLMSTGHAKDAEKVYTDAIKRLTNQNSITQANKGLGDVYAQDGSAKDAQFAYERAARHTQDPAVLAQIGIARGDLYAKGGQTREALREYKHTEAVSSDPTIKQTVSARLASLPSLPRQR